MKRHPLAWKCSLLTAGLFAGASLTQGALSDNVADAPFLEGTTFTETADTTAFTEELNEPDHAGHAGGRSGWVTFSPTQTGVYVFSTVGSDFDTVVNVYEPGGDLASYVGVTRSNNRDGMPAPGTDTASECRAFLQAGDFVAVAVDGVTANGVIGSGNAVLNISLDTTTEANDNFANAQNLGTGVPQTITGSNFHASRELGEPQHGGGTTFGSSSIWYRWTAPANKTYIFRTSGSTQDLNGVDQPQDTLLGIYTSSTPAADFTTLTAVGLHDNVGNGDLTSNITFAATAGTTYYIAVDGRTSVSTFNHRGDTVLIVEESPTQTLVPFGSSWEYYSQGSAGAELSPVDDPFLGAHPNFNSTWQFHAEGFSLPGAPAYDGPSFSAPSPGVLAFGGIDAQEPPATLLAHKRHLYVRKKVTVSENIPYVVAGLLADDGAIVYVDGVERARFNLAEGVTDFFGADSGINAPSETAATVVPLHIGLTAGDHVIAVSVFNQSTGSSDLGFDMTLYSESRKPTIISATTIVGSQGSAGAYQIVTGIPAESYGATNLPSGLTIDPATGLVSGTPDTVGTFVATLSATNPNGTTEVQATFSITPPYGDIALTAGPGLSTGFEEPARGSVTYIRTTGTELGFFGGGVDGGGTNTAGAAFAFGVVGPVSTNAVDHPAAGGSGSAAPNTAPPGKWLKLNNKGFGSANPLVFEKIDISALTPTEKANIVATIDVRALTTSGTTFETADYVRVWLEGSPDGITFTELGSRLVNITGDDAGAGSASDPIITQFRSDAGAYKTLSSEGLVTVTSDINSIRMVVNARNDSGSEYFYFDNVKFFISTGGGGGDSDGDGLDDSWEIANFGSIAAQNGTGDPDGDGADNANEFSAGTNPNSAASVLRITSVTRLSSSTVQVTFSSVAGKNYVVQTSSNMADLTWVDATATISATGASTSTSVVVSPLLPANFLRVRVAP